MFAAMGMTTSAPLRQTNLLFALGSWPAAQFDSMLVQQLPAYTVRGSAYSPALY